MDVVVIVTEFKQTLSARGYSRATVKTYSKHLSYFNRWLLDNQITDLKQVTGQVITDYQGAVQKKPLAMETKALYIRAIKRLFEYLIETNRLLINPAENIVETCRKNRKLAPVLSLDQVKRLLAQPNLSINTGIRDRAVMEVLYSTGIRINELVNLCIYDAELKDQVLYIRKAKGRVQRVVPLGKTAGMYLKQYLTNIRPCWARKNPRQRKLFLINTGRALNSNAARAFIRRYRLDAGIKIPVSPHTLRRSCATHMLRKGADIRYVQALLGHSCAKTTQIYAQVACADIKQTHSKTHPGKSL